MTASLAEAVWTALGQPRVRRLGIAVSGGSDSLALLHLLKTLSDTHDFALFAATVDHGLRPESAAEAAEVAAQCATLGIPHQTLKWQGWTGKGNLQDAARKARYELLKQWAAELTLEGVALGHTADDQAETLLMRLARRSGVDGLSGMAARRGDGDLLWLRPVLGVRREALREHLRDLRVAWLDDPSNDNPRFERVKARQALATLSGLGIDAAVLAEVSGHMAQARSALERQMLDAAHACVSLHYGAVAVDLTQLSTLLPETERRLWRHAIRWITGAAYAPRRAALAGLMDAVAQRRSTTLGGCAVICLKDVAWLFREYQVVADQRSAADAAWDARWVHDPDTGRAAPFEAYISALGVNGLKQCDNWRDLDLPRAALLSLPALWHDDTVISTPVLKRPSGGVWHLLLGEKAFFTTPL